MDKGYNFYVVAELREDLTANEKKTASAIIFDAMKRMKIVKENEVTYRQAPPFENFQDFGGVSGFYFMLEDEKCFFKRLAFYDVAQGAKAVAV